VVLGVLLCVCSFISWRSKRNWEQMDERLHIAFVAAVDAQFTIGVLSYLFLSPLPWMFFANPSANIEEPTLRFFGMEHTLVMLAATSVVHVGRVQSQRAATANLRHRRVWVTTLLALLIVTAAIP
jgi:cation transport ATPase